MRILPCSSFLKTFIHKFFYFVFSKFIKAYHSDHLNLLKPLKLLKQFFSLRLPTETGYESKTNICMVETASLYSEKPSEI